MQNNKQINAYSLKVQESEAMRPSAYTIDKTVVYYGSDQNNIAENGYPLKVFGLEQNINFPTLYFAQNKANTIGISIAEKELMRQKQILTREVSQAYYEIVYLLNKQLIFTKVDSLYRNFTKMTELRYQKGDISRLDLLNTKAKQQQISVALSEVKFNLESGIEKLKALIQSDSIFDVPMQDLTLVPVQETSPESSPDILLLKIQNEYQNAMLKVERNRLLPDLSFSYFNGTNSYEGAKNYQGFQVGMAVPIFFGEQNAKIKANKIAVNINENLQLNDLTTLKAKKAELSNELTKYKESIDYYNTAGKELSEEIIRSARQSYDMGGIDFFQFALSIENAMALTLNYYENVSKYNYFALEINYLTK
jgi:cobalt-zinc-cadmium resistance protein CzcA